MTVEQRIEKNIIKSAEAGTTGLNVDERGIRVNEKDVTYTIFSEFINKHYKKILAGKSKINMIVKNYLAKNSERLGNRLPVVKIPFMESDKNAIFNACGLSKDELKEVVSKIDSNDVNTSNHVIDDAFNVMCVIIASVFLREDKALVAKIKNMKNRPLAQLEKYKSTTYLASLYLGIRFYGALYVKYFPVSDANSNIMDYTIENLSGKYIIKKVNSILELIQYHTETNVEYMWDRLIRCSDVDILYFALNLNNRLNHLMKTLSNEYYKNKENNARIGSDDMNKTGTDGKQYTGDLSSISAELESAVRKVVTSFYSESVFDDDLISAACYKTKLSKARFVKILKEIIANKDSEPMIKNIISSIISYYLTTLGGTVDSIRSRDFALKMIKVYSVSNTRDVNILKLKENLTLLIKKNVKSIAQEGNANMVDRVRNSLYVYIVLYTSSTIG